MLGWCFRYGFVEYHLMNPGGHSKRCVWGGGVGFQGLRVTVQCRNNWRMMG